jgi:lipopolysaccharide/colanic/teichoic acid biosynthesis glycosyltransferase
MMTSNILLTTSKVLTLDLDNNCQTAFPACSLKWRKKMLWVTTVTDKFQLIPALKRQKWLQDCLKNSWVRRVYLDCDLGEEAIKLWADVCHQAKKRVFLRINSYNSLPHRQNPICWQIKRIFDWLVAFLLLIILSPVMFAIAVLIKINSPGPILFRQWRVGSRGELFQILKFRSMVIDAEKQHHQLLANSEGKLHKSINDPRVTSIGRVLRKFSLDELPQLINVLKGEMSLVGPRPWALYDALRLEKAGKQRLSALPGITGSWQVKARSNLLNLEAVTKCDLDYLDSWSLSQDLKILLLSVPRILLGVGAY